MKLKPRVALALFRKVKQYPTAFAWAVFRWPPSSKESSRASCGYNKDAMAVDILSIKLAISSCDM
jgi:hypothetical protein